MALLGYRAVFDEKGGFGGGSHRHRNKSFYKKVTPKKSFYIFAENHLVSSG